LQRCGPNSGKPSEGFPSKRTAVGPEKDCCVAEKKSAPVRKFLLIVTGLGEEKGCRSKKPRRRVFRGERPGEIKATK